jgi:hypothetical protein
MECDVRWKGRPQSRNVIDLSKPSDAAGEILDRTVDASKRGEPGARRRPLALPNWYKKSRAAPRKYKTGGGF